MISVTGYCNGHALVFGRGETEVEARQNAVLYAAEVGRLFPRLSGPGSWQFKRDACDRQMFAS